MKRWSLLFVLAAAFNLAIAAAFLLAPQALYDLARAGPAPLFEARFVGWCVAAFGLGYLAVARAPLRNRDIAIVSVVGKLGVVALVWSHWLTGATSLRFALLVSADVVWAALFVFFLVRTRHASA